MKNANAILPAFAWIFTTFLVLTGRAADPAGVPAGVAGSFVLEAKVEAVSRLPNPAESHYKDCLFTLKVYPNTTRQPPEAVMLSLPGFTNRVLTAHAAIKAGDLIRVEARRFDDMPGEYRELQLVDDFGEVELALLAVQTVSRIQEFSAPPAGTPWTETAGGNEPIRVVDPLPEEVAARLSELGRDLRELQTLRDAHGGWARWYDELAPARSNLAARLEAAPEGYLREGSFVLGEVKDTLGYTLSDDDPWYRNVIGTLVGMRDQFAKAGTDLILAPIPMRDQVYAAKFLPNPPADGVLQPYWLKFRHDLLIRGVEVVDLVPFYTRELETRPYLFHAHSRDGHPGGDGAVLTAEVIARRLKRYSFKAPAPAYRLEPAFLRLPSSEKLYFPGPAEIPYVQVLEMDGRPVGENPQAEALLIGDSMVTAPPAGANGSIGVHAARQSGVAMRYFKRAGSAPLLSYHLSTMQDPGLFSGRRVCVFVFSASYLAAPNRDWRFEPFMDHAMQRSVASAPLVAGWEGSHPFAFLRGARALADFFSCPAGNEGAPGRADGLRLGGAGAPEASLAFPEWVTARKEKAFIGLEVAAVEDAVWQVHENGVPRELRVPAGLGTVTFCVAPEGPEWCGLKIPAGAPSVALYAVSVRREGAGGGATARGSSRLLARYNSADDFALLQPRAPSQRIEGDLIRVDCDSAEQSLRFPSRVKKAGAYPDRMYLRMEAGERTSCRVLCDGVLCGLVTIDPYLSAHEITLPRCEQVELRFPRGPTPVRLHEIAMRATINPAGAAPSPGR